MRCPGCGGRIRELTLQERIARCASYFYYIVEKMREGVVPKNPDTIEGFVDELVKIKFDLAKDKQREIALKRLTFKERVNMIAHLSYDDAYRIARGLSKKNLIKVAQAFNVEVYNR